MDFRDFFLFIGLQFFIPVTAWYCKLCDSWIGDLHCASQHLKSQVHSQNYAVSVTLHLRQTKIFKISKVGV